jgi:protein involved in polysaccharide export with SLBB domain
MVGLTVTDPGIQLIPAGGSQQVRIPAEVSRSGQFQVTAELVGEDGVVWGPPVQLSVVSTAYGALTVILIVVAGGVLVVMVALRIVQRVRDRRARLAREALGATDPTPATDPASAPLRDVIPAPPPVDQARTEQQR